jgi:hypothetical protein
VDSYVDTAGRMHVLYHFKGPDTKGEDRMRHSIVEGGKVTKTVDLPETLTETFRLPTVTDQLYCRIIQDTAGRFYLITPRALIGCDSKDGTKFGTPVALDLKGHQPEYSGIAVTAPRCGTPPADVVDCVFPAGKGKKVVYIRIRLK